MLSRLPLRLAGRLWAVLLVLTVALSALAPGAAPVGLRSGSAFSVDTVEMAVAPARPQLAVARTEAFPPMPLVPAAPLVLAISAPLVLARAPQVLPRSTGPPLAALPLRAPGTPRAPPQA